MARILVVDDENDTRSLIQFMLDKDGHTVETAKNGVEALAAMGIDPVDAGRTLPDLVIMDLMMPELDGVSACARLAANPRTRSVPVIVLTGDGGEARQTIARVPNVVAYVDKPFEPRQLRDLIAQKLPPSAPEVRRA